MEPPTMDELRAIRDAIVESKAEKAGLSPDRRRTAKNADLFAAGVHPATRRPLVRLDETCGTCEFAHRYSYHSRSYWKCEKHRLGESHSAASDIRKSWPACDLWSARG